MDEEEAKEYLQSFLDRYAKDERILRMLAFPHHPPVSAYAHSLMVVRKCVELVVRYNLAVNWEDLLLAALLHDFYLYDFRKNSAFRNCFIHPRKAMENAIELFDVNNHVAKCIRTHMFPATPLRIPKSKEAWILTIADKIAAISDIFPRKKRSKDSL